MSWGCIIYKRCMACFATLFITRGERKLPYRTQASRASPVVLSCLRIRPSLTQYVILQHDEFGYSSKVCQVKPFLPQLLDIYLYLVFRGPQIVKYAICPFITLRKQKHFDVPDFWTCFPKCSVLNIPAHHLDLLIASPVPVSGVLHLGHFCRPATQ